MFLIRSVASNIYTYIHRFETFSSVLFGKLAETKDFLAYFGWLLSKIYSEQELTYVAVIADDSVLFVSGEKQLLQPVTNEKSSCYPKSRHSLACLFVCKQEYEEWLLLTLFCFDMYVVV